MTLIVGLKIDNGYILATDCLVEWGGSTEQQDKIHRSSAFGKEKEVISFAAIATAGDLTYGRFLNQPFLEQVTLDPTKVFKLSDPEISSWSLRTLQERIDSLIGTPRYLWRPKSDEDLKKDEEASKLKALIDPVAFIEHTKAGHYEHTILRARSGVIDLVQVRRNTVIPVERYILSGSGEELVRDFLRTNYKENPRIVEGINLVSEALRLVFTQPTKYRGYSVTCVTKEEGKLEVKSTVKLDALNVEREEILEEIMA